METDTEEIYVGESGNLYAYLPPAGIWERLKLEEAEKPEGEVLWSERGYTLWGEYYYERAAPQILSVVIKGKVFKAEYEPIDSPPDEELEYLCTLVPKET